MKHSRTKLNALIDDLIKSRMLIQPGDDVAPVTQDYLNRLRSILRELIELSHEPDYKGRHGIYYDLRSYHTHENAWIDAGITKLPENATAEQYERALETAANNVESAAGVVKQLARTVRYHREDREIKDKAQS